MSYDRTTENLQIISEPRPLLFEYSWADGAHNYIIRLEADSVEQAHTIMRSLAKHLEGTEPAA